MAARLGLLMLLLVAAAAAGTVAAAGKGKGRDGGGGGLRFRREGGTFKVLQVADMHYADGRSTPCQNVLPSQEHGCSDLNTTAFLYRVLRAEDPDLVVFTGQPPPPLPIDSCPPCLVSTASCPNFESKSLERKCHALMHSHSIDAYGPS
jgi:hypothetical protein